MSDPDVITSTDPILSRLNFKPYRNKVERRVVPFLPGPGEPQSMEIHTPWGTQLTARKGDVLVSEVETPYDYWPVDPVIFEESYIITRPGYCAKNAITLLAPLMELTDNPEKQFTIMTLEGPETVKAADFYLAKGIKGEIWPYPKEKIKEVMMPAE